MRGDDAICGSLFSYIDLEDRVRADHPLRVIRELANAALGALSGLFEPLYSPIGRRHCGITALGCWLRGSARAWSRWPR